MIGIISEGTGDQGVIINIIKGICDIDESEILPLRPIDTYDETDLGGTENLTLGGWSRVKQECETKTQIEQFLIREGNEHIIIHTDTAECEEYGIDKPIKDDHYCENLWNLVVQKLKSWLGDHNEDFPIYAIAIEEIEAWLLTIHEKRDSSNSANPKRRYEQVAQIQAPKNLKEGKKASVLFKKLRNFNKENYRGFNCSLDKFCSQLEEKICG